MEDVSREDYEKRIKYILERINPEKYGYSLRQDSKNVIQRRGAPFSPYNLSKYNQELMEKYYSGMVNTGLSLPRTGVSLGITCRLMEKLEKDFNIATKQDFEDLVTKIRTMNLTETTKVDYLLKLKRLDKWFNGGEEYTERTRRIKTNLQRKYMKLPKDMISQDGAQRMVGACNNARDRAFVHFLWESGCRIGEAINLKMSNLGFHKGECRVNLYGKMGARRILLLECVRDLENYLLVRPEAKSTDPLFVLRGTVNNGKAMNHAAVSKLLKEIKQRAGITKEVYAIPSRCKIINRNNC